MTATYQDHIDGVLALFNQDGKKAWTRESLPDLLPPEYIEIIVTRRYGGVQRMSGLWDGGLYRIVARAVGQTIAGTYRMWDAIDAIQGQSFLIADQSSTPAEFENDAETIEPDDGWFSGARNLTYALI